MFHISTSVKLLNNHHFFLSWFLVAMYKRTWTIQFLSPLACTLYFSFNVLCGKPGKKTRQISPKSKKAMRYSFEYKV